MTGMSDIRFAAKMRDIITSVAEDTVNRLRPEPKLAKVYSVDVQAGRAKVLFAGEVYPNTVTVKFSPNMAPTATMDATYATNGMDAPSDVVRVAGRPGNYWIDSFVFGVPQSAVQPGFVFPFLGDTTQIPQGYFLLDGSGFSSVVYPRLALLCADHFGAHNGNTYYLPDMRGRFILGVSGSHILGATGGEETHVLTIAEMPSHSHPHHPESWRNTGGSTKITLGSTYFFGTDSVGGSPRPNTDPTGGGGAHNNMPPFGALNLIVKN